MDDELGINPEEHGHTHGPNGQPHRHGPDGRHIVTTEDAKGKSSFILSHHDMRIEGKDGKSLLGAQVESSISPKGKPGEVIHTEKNVYEPENEVYGSHMSYTSPGEYVITENVKLPDGKSLKVEFPVYVPAHEGSTAEPEHDHHGPNYLLIIGGIVVAGFALRYTYRLGRKSAGQSIAGLVVFSLVASTVSVRAFAQEKEEPGHMHGPDGRHIVTQADADNAAGPQLKAFPGPNREESATKKVDGLKFVLSIENEAL